MLIINYNILRKQRHGFLSVDHGRIECDRSSVREGSPYLCSIEVANDFYHAAKSKFCLPSHFRMGIFDMASSADFIMLYDEDNN